MEEHKRIRKILPDLLPNLSYKDDLIGVSLKNHQGEIMTIIKKENIVPSLITIQFETTKQVREHVPFRNFKTGGVKDIYFPTICNKACVGNATTKENGIHKTSYICWRAMINRCYNKNDKSYKWYGAKGCFVCEEWLCYENFEKWYNENFYQIKQEIMNLDKDIIDKNNKEYCPNKCVFVPQNINKAIINVQKNRGSLPLGVYYNRKNRYKKYAVQICLGDGISKQLGAFATVEEAFNIYKKSKEQYLKSLADKYKRDIPSILYDALYNYKIEITD